MVETNTHIDIATEGHRAGETVMHVTDFTRRKTHAVIKGPSMKDCSVWADTFLDRHAEAIARAPADYEREKIPQFLAALQKHMSWEEAAEFADFRSTDRVMCPPGKKARIVMTSFLGSQPDGQELLNALQTLNPETVPAPLSIHPSWETECERKNDFGGRVCSMMTADAGLITVMRDTDRNAAICRVSSSVSDAKLHQQALDKVVDALMKGELNIFEFSAAQKAGIKVEPGSNSGKYLLCLHTHAESRIYGVYEKKTGTIIWRGLIDSHRKWTQFIKSFKL